MAYQDIWIRGTVSAPGDRRCADRYGLIRQVVAAYSRQVTAWDLGANHGYFGCRLVDEFGAVSVMVEPRAALRDACAANALPTTIALTHALTARDLEEVAASEHADVVLALNVLHHMPDWSLALDAVLALGEDVVIETPGRDDVGSAHYPRAMAILDALESLRPDVLGTAPSHVTAGVQRPVFLLRRPKAAVSAGYAYRHRVRLKGPQPVREHVISSTPHEKSIRFADGESRPWVAGMNLWNWLQLGGSYPDRRQLRDIVTRALAQAPLPHGDLKPWNVILRGDQATVIDAGHRHNDDVYGAAQTLAWVDHPETAYVR